MDHIARLAPFRTEAAAFEKAVRRAFDRGAPVPAVPSCPGWTVTDLVRHLGGVHRFLAYVLRERLTAPPDPAGLTLPEVPDGPDALTDWFAQGARELAELFDELGPDTAVWTWSAEQTTGFWLRMQLIELAVHRWDAESATGTPVPLAPDVAADAVTQTIEVMAPARRGWQQAPPGAGRGTASGVPTVSNPGRSSSRGTRCCWSPVPPPRPTSRPRAGPRTSRSSSGTVSRPPPCTSRATPPCSRTGSRSSHRSDPRGPRARPGQVPGCGPPGRKTRAATYHGGMSFLRRHRAATPAGPDFDVLAMDPGTGRAISGPGCCPRPTAAARVSSSATTCSADAAPR